MLWKSVTNRVLIIIFLVFSAHTIRKISEVVNGSSTCVCAYDGFGYYMYLPHIFQNGNLKMTPDWAQKLQNKYCNGIYVYQLEKRNFLNHVDIYHMGLSFLQLPAYLIGDAFASVLQFPRDGFSKPYHITYLLNSLLFVFLGLFYLRKFLLLFFTEEISAITLLIIYGATNIYITFTQQHDLPHLYLFSLNACWLYFFFSYIKNSTRKHLFWSAIIFGCTTFIRPTQVLWGIIPLFFLLNQNIPRKKQWLQILLFPLFSIAWNIPQIIYWKIVGGDFLIPNLHTEDIVLNDPNFFKFLFSYRKGWLLYSPIFLLLIFGFYHIFKFRKKIFWPLFLFTLLYIYVMCSWECWWYASSFGSRVMVDIYPILAIPIGVLMLSTRKIFFRSSLILFVLSCFTLNAIQSNQLLKGYLSTNRMSKQHYWYIFGKSEISNFTEIRAEIERSDLNWPEKYNGQKIDGIHYVTKDVLLLDTQFVSLPFKDLTIDRIKLYDLIDSDETLFEVSFKVQTSDNTKNAALRMEAVSAYNVYSWNAIEISKDKLNDSFNSVNYKFNLPYIRHRKDEMQIYIDNNDNLKIVLKDFKIKAHTLLRD